MMRWSWLLGSVRLHRRCHKAQVVQVDRESKLARSPSYTATSVGKGEIDNQTHPAMFSREAEAMGAAKQGPNRPKA